MIPFIEQTLHEKIEMEPYNAVQKLPLLLQSAYDFYQMKIQGNECILACPKENPGLAVLRVHQKQMERLTKQRCVLYLKTMNYYSKEKMLQEGIPFIWEGHQIYMPFLGMLLNQSETRDVIPCYKISFLTQKFLLSALYEEWDQMTATQASDRLNVSKMSMTRVFDEIESLGLPLLEKKGRSRKYVKAGSKREIWVLIEQVLRSPLIKEFYLERQFTDFQMRSGMSALAKLSMLEDNLYPTFAVTKYEVKERGILQERQVPIGEMPGCVVQELGYCIPFAEGKVIDPLSVYLLLKQNGDPRVEKALDEMLEEYVW